MTTVEKLGLGIGAGLLLVGYVAFAALDGSYAWGRIGVALAFFGVVVGLLADQLAWLSEQYVFTEGGSGAHHDAARASAPIFRGIATALIVVGAAYQLVGDTVEGEQIVVADFDEEYETPYVTPRFGRKTLHPARLEGTLRLMHTRIGHMGRAEGCTELLVKACPEKPCACDDAYKRVSYKLDWDLHGLHGIPIVLCEKPKPCFAP